MKVRLDKYLWAIRIFKTRTQAAAACDAGKVRMEGNAVKASRIVQVGDVMDIKTEHRRWTIRVTQLIQQRVQFQEAIKHYEDITPKEELERLQYQASSFHTGKRPSKIGRPTKKERRELDDFLDAS